MYCGLLTENFISSLRLKFFFSSLNFSYICSIKYGLLFRLSQSNEMILVSLPVNEEMLQGTK